MSEARADADAPRQHRSGSSPSPHEGYAHPLYARSFEEWGEPLELPSAGGWLIVRGIPGTPYRDAMGPYPLLACADWSAVCDDLAALPADLVSLTLVSDPLGDVSHLRDCFDAVRPYKRHHYADLTVPIDERVSRHHRRAARKALGMQHVEVVDAPVEHLDEWTELHEEAARRLGLGGIKAFSRRAFERQLTIPGMVMVRASAEGRTLGMQLVLQRAEVASVHLMSLRPEGYDLGTSYALDWATSEHFAGRCRWLSFGGAAGAGDDDEPPSGLEWYKRGWCTTSWPSHLCTVVLDREAYARLTRSRAPAGTSYFPAYRSGELL